MRVNKAPIGNTTMLFSNSNMAWTAPLTSNMLLTWDWIQQAFAACLDSHRYQDEIQADASDAARVGISGTPSFVVNGRILIGALPFSDFKTVIDEELAAKP